MMTKTKEVQTITKAHIVDRVHDELGKDGGTQITKKGSAELVDQVFKTIKEQITLLRDELEEAKESTSSSSKKAKKPERRLKISGFGNFIVRHKAERTGRNPQTKKRIMISARYVLTFKPSQVLKRAINDHHSES